MKGWIKLHRRSLESVVFQSANLWKTWSYCLLKANHSNGYKILFNGNELNIERGQFLTGREKGASECNLKNSTFWQNLKKLEKLGKVNIKSDNKKSIVTIVNWAFYQNAGYDSDSASDIKATTKQQQDNIYNNINKEKNERMFYEVYYHWNRFKINELKSLDIYSKNVIRNLLESYKLDEIKAAISNYVWIFNSNSHYFDYRYPLSDFLQKGIYKFFDFETANANFIKKNGNEKTTGQAYDDYGGGRFV